MGRVHERGGKRTAFKRYKTYPYTIEQGQIEDGLPRIAGSHRVQEGKTMHDEVGYCSVEDDDPVVDVENPLL